MEHNILLPGDDQGHNAILEYKFPNGIKINAIGVPQSWDTPLGPTWSYIIEHDELTIIDPGCYGTISSLKDGLEYIGYSLESVGSVILTHGHMDHDGNTKELLTKSGADLYAHEVYGILKNVDRWQIEHDWRGSHSNFPDMEDPDVINRVAVNEKETKDLKVTNPVSDGSTLGNFEFFYTPGHSPDELCIKLDNVLFSGDHILPKITPHPSMSLSYEPFKHVLPKAYQNSNEYYGLLTYMKSLKKASCIDSVDVVLAAHRTFRYEEFNLIDLTRIPEIIDHHKERCMEILNLINLGIRDLTELTHKTFTNRVLEGNQFYSAFTENISHLELLEEAGDIVFEGGKFIDVSPTGSTNFSNLIDNS